MRFTKMQGAGNDYVYVNGFVEKVADPAAAARAVSDRHFGIGADGLILILPSNTADVRMRMFNADGSEAQMCGNGIRCLAKYAYDNSISRANPMRVETAAGVKTIDLAIGADGKVASATVDMGEPILEAARIPVNINQDRVVDYPITTSAGQFKMTCVSMGNPHMVIYVPDVAAVPLEKLGAELETSKLFPQKVNVHFVQVSSPVQNRVNVHFVQVGSPSEVTMRTWERGSGITLACGTGASAVCVAGVLTGRSGRDVLIHLPGGDLRLNWRESDNHVFMTGPAVEVFSGDWPAAL